MIALPIILTLMVAALVLTLAYAGHRIETLVRENHSADMCQVIDHARATTLRDAAKAWDTVDAEATRKELSWTPAARSGPNGPSMVEMWLNSLADEIDAGLFPADYSGSITDVDSMTFAQATCIKCSVSRNAEGWTPQGTLDRGAGQ